MNDDPGKSGYFLFTLDTELAWGHYDCFRPGLFSKDGKRERDAIIRLLDMLDEFGLVATWALVGHLFYEKCEECQLCPVREWEGKFDSYAQIYNTNYPLWYGADIIDILLKRAGRAGRHEIAFHGYTHRLFDPKTLSGQEAHIEISEWLRVTSRKNVRPPTAIVFPRNRVGHLPIFEQYGFKCYRGDEVLPPDYYSLPFIGKLFNRIDLITQLRTPQVYPLPEATRGMVNLPASRGLLRVDVRFERFLQYLNLAHLPTASLIRGVEKAAREKKVFHLYSHPYEFRAEKDFTKLRQVFEVIADKVQSGELKTISMTSLAEIIQKAETHNQKFLVREK
jgi:peptidoglycan/xylan/chitin deacetylase (PgdA/CDA1 family)